MKIPDFHVSNVSVDETFFIDNLDLLEIIISSLVSQYIDQEIDTEKFAEKFTVPIVDTSKTVEEQKEQIKAQLPPEQKALPVATQNLIAEVLQAAPPANVEVKEKKDSSGNVVEKSIEVSAKEELNSDGTAIRDPVTNKPVGYDTVVSTFSQEAEDTATKVTFEIEQSTTSVIDEVDDDVVIAAGLYLPRPGIGRTIVQHSVESTVRRVVSRMSKNNEGIYPAIASVMESTYNIESTNLGKMLDTFYVYFVDVTKESGILKWSFVYPVQGSGGTVVYNYEPLTVPSIMTADVGVTINADYLRKPNIFDLTFGDTKTGNVFKTTVDLNPPVTPENPNPVSNLIPFDEPGTPFIVINGGDKVNIKNIEKVFDPPDPTPTPSPTVTITHPTPTPSVSITPSTTIYPTPTPTMTITPSPTMTGTPDITTLFAFTQDGTDVDVSINTTQMNIENTTEDIAGFTLAFFVPSSWTAATGDSNVSLMGSFAAFEYRYATSNNSSNILYITGYCSFSGSSQPVLVDRETNNGYMNVLRIKNIAVDNVTPVNPSYNNVVAVSNKEAKLWDLNVAYTASIRSGFYVSDMTQEYIMLHVDGTLFEEDASSFDLQLEGIVIQSVEDIGDFNGWTIQVNETKDGISGTKGAGIAKMRKGDLRRLKLRYSDIKGDIKIKEAHANDKKIEAGYLIPEDVQFDNGTARIRTKHLKDTLLKSFLVMTKGDLGTVTASSLLQGEEWTVEAKYSTRDGYTRIMGYSKTARAFTDLEPLFTYTNVVRTQRVDSQFPGYAFVNALNTNIATMANVLTSDDMAGSMSRFTWLLDHIAGKPDLPTGETLGEFFVKSDVTFDGRILVNDVVALKQYILGGLKYPDERPLGVFEVKYTINSISQQIFDILSGKLNEIASAIETEIYGSSTGKNAIIIGSERELSGEAHIYARVFWSNAELYSGAIKSAKKMFENVSFSGYSLVPENPTGVLAVSHNGGNSFTVYGTGFSEISYSTYHTSEIKKISSLSTSAYTHDITIPELQSGFDVLYVTGSGGRKVAVVVTDTIDPTPTMSTTISPTPTVSLSYTPTPTMTITDSPDKARIIDPEKPFGVENHTNPPIGNYKEESVTWAGYILTEDKLNYIQLSLSDVLCVFNGDDPDNLIPIQYMKTPSLDDSNFTDNLYHYKIDTNNPVFKMVFKLLRYDEKKIYDLVNNSNDIESGTKHDFDNFQYISAGIDPVQYFSLGDSVDVEYKSERKMISKVLNTVTSNDTSFTIEDDGFKWVSFRYLPTDKRVKNMFENGDFVGAPKLNTTFSAQNSSTSYKKVFSNFKWTRESFELNYTSLFKISNLGGVTYNFTGKNKYSSDQTTRNLVDGFNWISYLSSISINISEIGMEYEGVKFGAQNSSTSYKKVFSDFKWTRSSFTFDPDVGYVVYIPEDIPKKYIEWPQAGPPQSTVPESSGNPTFVVSNLSTSSTGWKSFNVSIDTNTLNPYEFYVDNNPNDPHRASVDRKGDNETTYVKSNSDSRRYQRIRSIELVFTDHVYLDSSTSDDNVRTTDTANTGILGPGHDNMYVYCARTTVNEVKETRVMIVNAHNEFTSGLLKIPDILFIEGTQTLDEIKGLIDWSKSYIGTTSVYKAAWDPMLPGGTNPAYEWTKYSTSTGNTIRDFYWKKNDAAVGASSTPEHGLFLRYSIDDGNGIIPGGVSKESFTSVAGSGTRLMIDEYYLGNIDGNIEEY